MRLVEVDFNVNMFIEYCGPSDMSRSCWDGWLTDRWSGNFDGLAGGASGHLLWILHIVLVSLWDCLLQESQSFAA